MITDEDTARRTPGLANVRISGQTVRRRLHESRLRARRPVVHTVVGGFTPGNTSFLVLNLDF